MGTKNSSVKLNLSTKKLRFLGILAFTSLIILILGISIYFVIDRSDRGIEIPSDYNEYENEVFTLGYPNDWPQPEEIDSTLQIASDELDQTGEDLPSIVYFSWNEFADNEEQAEEIRKLVVDNNCEDLKDKLEEDSEDYSVDEFESIRINNKRACVYTYQTDFFGDSIYTKLYILPLKDENVLVVSALDFLNNEETFDKIENVIRTLKIKD